MGAALALLSNLHLCFELTQENAAIILEKLAELAETGEVVSHFDFSSPEEAFQIEIVENSACNSSKEV